MPPAVPTPTPAAGSVCGMKRSHALERRPSIDAQRAHCVHGLLNARPRHATEQTCSARPPVSSHSFLFLCEPSRASACTQNPPCCTSRVPRRRHAAAAAAAAWQTGFPPSIHSPLACASGIALPSALGSQPRTRPCGGPTPLLAHASTPARGGRAVEDSSAIKRLFFGMFGGRTAAAGGGMQPGGFAGAGGFPGFTVLSIPNHYVPLPDETFGGRWVGLGPARTGLPHCTCGGSLP